MSSIGLLEVVPYKILVTSSMMMWVELVVLDTLVMVWVCMYLSRRALVVGCVLAGFHQAVVFLSSVVDVWLPLAWAHVCACVW